MERMVIDLGIARDNEVYNIYQWKQLYIGDCSGDVAIKLGGRHTSALDPNEFNNLANIKSVKYLYITNTAQAGKTLVIYFEEKHTNWWEIWK